MGSSKLQLLAATVMTALAAAPASAQFEDKTCISFNTFSGHLIEQAAHDLGFKENVEHVVEDQFIADLQAKQRDLIGLELAFAKIQKKTEILDLFKQQHAGGAKFIVSYAHLDEWPELQEFMGVASAVDVSQASSVDGPGSSNPLFSASGFYGPVSTWSDHGDSLEVLPGWLNVGVFVSGPSLGKTAVVMDPERTRVCCGFNFDQYVGTPSSQVRRFVEVMMLCEDDVNLDGSVDLSDVLELQNRILSSADLGNRNYDLVTDFFDFLHFFNRFDAMCLP